MLLPKRVKRRRVQRGRMKGKANKGNIIAYGEYGLVVQRGDRDRCNCGSTTREIPEDTRGAEAALPMGVSLWRGRRGS